jgi:trigger factor
MGPDQFAQQVVQAGQVPVLVSEVVRGKALALVLESANVVDASGRPVDLEALREDTTAETIEVTGETADASAEQSHDDHASDDADLAHEGHEGHEGHAH